MRYMFFSNCKMHRMHCFVSRALLVGTLLGAVIGLAGTGYAGGEQTEVSASVPEGVNSWIARLHKASSSHSYTGTLVVLSSSGAMSSSRIAHVCSGEQELERVETLTGVPRITYRLNNEVRTFWPQSHQMRREPYAPAGALGPWVSSPRTGVADFYSAEYLGAERVAGFAADVVWFKPRDAWRFGYRIWSEHKSGMVLKMQTLRADGDVLEQVAFSALELDAPMSMAPLQQGMQATAGYAVHDVQRIETVPVQHGWVLGAPVPGFALVGCYMQHMRAADTGAPAAHAPTPPEPAPDTLQCIYSDGLATVSLFLEARVSQRVARRSAMGATHMLSQRVGAQGWLTAVGEVPLATLVLFASRVAPAR